jgi:DNA-directed RNA polymerase specialized sigma24 family protein
MTEYECARINIKRRLNSYRDLDVERRQILEELKRLETQMASPAGPNMDGMPRRPGVSNPVQAAAVKHAELVDRYRAQLDKLTAAQTDIENTIDGLEPTERMLARFRYIDGLSWEDVCEKMNYSWRQTHRIHSRMLDKLTAAEM